jgi:hypothetical protein
VAADLREEFCDRLGREVADGDDAVVAGGSTERGSVGPVGAAPDGDAGLLEWPGEEPHALDVKMAAGMVDGLPRPELCDDLQSVVEELGVRAVVARLAEGAELPGVVGADTDTEDEAAARQAVEADCLRASFHGRRRGNGVTKGPVRRRSVRVAMAARAIQASM